MDKKNNSNNEDINLDTLLSYYSNDDTSKLRDNSVSVSDTSAEPRSNPETIKQNSSNNNSTEQRKKFVVHINDGDDKLSDSDDAAKPADNSSVYFSNYKGRHVNVVPVQHDSIVQPEPSSNEKKKNKKSGKNNKSAKKKIKSIGSRFAIILFVFILIVTSVASYISITTINDILAITSSDDLVEVRVYKKTSSGEEDESETLTYDEIINILAENGLISQKELCKVFARFRHLDNSAYQFKPGVYTFKKSMGVEGMLYKCLQQNKTAETVTVSFPEGWTLTQMFEKLEQNKVCTAKSLYSVLEGYMETHSEDYPFLKSVPQSEDRYQIFEGYFFPDTYDFYVESDPNFVVDKMFSSFDAHWTQEYQERAEKLGYTMDEIITIASIIQKEAADSSQMKDVSSVIHNRLKNSMNYPSIGCDSTYDYISNYFDTSNYTLSKKNDYLGKYATDTNTGLPPGPIANPGEDAIKAALYPADTSYYFFQHDKNGKIYLATNKNQFDYDYSVVQRVNNEEE